MSLEEENHLLKIEIEKLKQELEETKEHLKKYTNNAKKYYEKNKEEIKQKVKEYKEKTGKLYAHVRKRDGDLYFTRATPKINDRTVPVIFSKKQDGSGGAQSRLGIIDKIRGVEIS